MESFDESDNQPNSTMSSSVIGDGQTAPSKVFTSAEGGSQTYASLKFLYNRSIHKGSLFGSRRVLNAEVSANHDSTEVAHFYVVM